MEPALDALLLENGRETEELLARFRPGPGDEEELRQGAEQVVGRAADLAGKPHENVLRWAMGQLMPGFLGRVEPARVLALLRETLPPAATEGRS